MAAQQLLPLASSLDVSIPNFGTFVPRRTKDADGPGTNLLRQYLCKESELFKKLNERREEGWNNPAGDKFFDKQRKNADEADETTQQRFYDIMLRIGSEMERVTGALSSANGQPIRSILDLCMAPGGYTSTALEINPKAYACGITLPMNEGGHDLVVVREEKSKERVKDVIYQDITMYVPNIDGIPLDVPKDHLDVSKFILEQPFGGQDFDLVFCDGQLLRTQQLGDHRAPGAKGETERLSLSQLIIATERVGQGGTIIMLLHNPDRYPSAKLLSQFDSFSTIRLFKPEVSHRHRGSFYMIAQNVRDCIGKDRALREWREAWKMWTFDLPGRNFNNIEKEMDDLRGANELINTFGKKLLNLASPVWEIQYEALGNATWGTAPSYGKSQNERDLHGKIYTPPKHISDSSNWRREQPTPQTPDSKSINPKTTGRSPFRSPFLENSNPGSRRLSSAQAPNLENWNQRSRRLSSSQVLNSESGNRRHSGPSFPQTTESGKFNPSYGGPMGSFGKTSKREGNDVEVTGQMDKMQLSDNDNWTRPESSRVPSSFLMKNWRSKTSDNSPPE